MREGLPGCRIHINLKLILLVIVWLHRKNNTLKLLFLLASTTTAAFLHIYFLMLLLGQYQIIERNKKKRNFRLSATLRRMRDRNFKTQADKQEFQLKNLFFLLYFSITEMFFFLSRTPSWNIVRLWVFFSVFFLMQNKFFCLLHPPVLKHRRIKMNVKNRKIWRISLETGSWLTFAILFFYSFFVGRFLLQNPFTWEFQLKISQHVCEFSNLWLLIFFGHEIRLINAF